MTTIYDWPIGTIKPSRQLFVAPTAAVSGGRTLGGVPTVHPSPGGFSRLTFEFGVIGRGAGGRLSSFIASNLSAGRVWRVPIVISPQLVAASDFLTDGADMSGTEWSNGGGWSNGQNWAFNPLAEAAGSALEGETSFSIDMAQYGPVLQPGHGIGMGDAAYIVISATYADDVATVTVNPPLRKDVSAGDYIRFRPRMTGICINPEAFGAAYDSSGVMRPGSITFVEVMV